MVTRTQTELCFQLTVRDGVRVQTVVDTGLQTESLTTCGCTFLLIANLTTSNMYFTPHC